MSYIEFDYNAQYRGRQNGVDVRVPIARHINWTQNTNPGTTIREWRVPEPDNYNYAIRTAKPVYCKFIKDAVFYKELATNKWWNVFYVPQEQIKEFDAWARAQDMDYLWYHTKPAKIKPYKKMLYNTKKGDISTEERLFQMGYYATLRDKYFTDANDKTLLDRLGPVRDCVLNMDLDEV